jgi:hypothetical protein
MSEITDEQIREWERQHSHELSEYELATASIPGQDLTPVSVESKTPLNVELEQKAAGHKTEYERLGILIQGALSRPTEK